MPDYGGVIETALARAETIVASEAFTFRLPWSHLTMNLASSTVPSCISFTIIPSFYLFESFPEHFDTF